MTASVTAVMMTPLNMIADMINVAPGRDNRPAPKILLRVARAIGPLSLTLMITKINKINLITSRLLVANRAPALSRIALALGRSRP